MGFFGDKLLFRLNASSMSSGEFKLQIEKEDSRFFHLLPFSCISLIGSQLTILSSRHPRSLSRKVLEFVENPQSKFETTSYVSGFKLEIFEGKGGFCITSLILCIVGVFQFMMTTPYKQTSNAF